MRPIAALLLAPLLASCATPADLRDSSPVATATVKGTRAETIECLSDFLENYRVFGMVPFDVTSTARTVQARYGGGLSILIDVRDDSRAAAYAYVTPLQAPSIAREAVLRCAEGSPRRTSGR